MAITLVCECGRRLDFKDEYAGRQVRCPDCDQVNTVGTAPAVEPQAGDATFAREKFLLKQKALAIREKYDIVGEDGQPLLFVERPRHMFRGLLAAGVGLAAAFAVFAVFALLTPEPGTISENAEAGLALVGMALAAIAFALVTIALSPKRHVTFYRDASGRERLLEILQDSKWQPITATFTVRDEEGKVLALLRKNWLYNIFRRRWVCLTPGGNTLMMAKEDSIILSLLRRLLGTFFGLLRAQFIFTRGTSDVVIGEFNRKFTLLDRYVLDMTRDARRVVDRRLALAMGVMLDSGERR